MTEQTTSMQISDSQSIHLTIKNPIGRETQLEVTSSTTVDMIMLQYEEITGVPPADQRLIFEGKQLERLRTISGYGVQDGAILFMVFALRGA